MKDGWFCWALDLEDHGLVVAYIDDPGAFAGSLEHVLAGGRQLLQMDPGALVAAVFGPHDREDAQFGEVGFLADELDDELVFFPGQVVLFEYVFIDHDGQPFIFPPAACCRRGAIPRFLLWRRR